MKFILRNSYLKGTTSELGSQYGIDFEKSFFPDFLNVPKNYNFIGNKPDLSTFIKFSNSSKQVDEVNLFYEHMPNEWNFNEELLKNFLIESLVSAKAILMFLREAFHLQSTIASLTNKPINAIHPFGGRLVSLPGFAFAIFHFYYYNDVNAFSVMNPDANGRTQTSRGEYEYISWLNFKGSDFIQGNFSAEGPKHFGKFYVDGYNQRTKTVYQYKG